MSDRALITALNFSLSVLIVLPLAAFAQGGGVFTVRPAKVELVVAPGERVETAISVSNTTASPLVVSVGFEDVEPAANADVTSDPAKLLGEKRGSYSLRDWMASPREKYDVLTGEAVSIPISVTVPRDALPGGRYGAAVIVARPALDLASGGQENLAFETQVATLYFVRVLGDAKEEGALRKFGISGEKFVRQSSGEPLEFFVSYENSGDVHLNPYGGIRISGMFGSERTVAIDPWAVYPKTTRTRDIVYPQALSPGFYRATLELNRGYGDVVDTASVRFAVVPSFRASILSFVLLLLVVLGVRRSLRISRNRVS